MNPLELTSPPRTDKAVRELQKALNTRYAGFKIDRRIAVDGELGTETISATAQIGRSVGARRKPLIKLKNGRISVALQELILGTRKPTLIERLNVKRRAGYRQKLRARFAAAPGRVAVSRAEKYLGVTEEPAGSNWGPVVSKFILFTGYTFPVPWCGCFAAWVTVKLGGANIPDPLRLGYAGYITADAKAGDNGLTEVSFKNARAGDILVLWGDDHIEVVTRRPKGDSIQTIGGNTSPDGNGSQSNGGGVFARTRSASDVTTVARPDYS